MVSKSQVNFVNPMQTLARLQGSAPRARLPHVRSQKGQLSAGFMEHTFIYSMCCMFPILVPIVGKRLHTVFFFDYVMLFRQRHSANELFFFLPSEVMSRCLSTRVEHLYVHIALTAACIEGRVYLHMSEGVSILIGM